MDVVEIISLITGLLGLISAGVATYFAIANFIKSLKGKNATEIWSLIMTMADAAMTEAEASGKAGVDKKKMVIDSVSAGLKAAGLDITEFMDQLNTYIDEAIAFANGLQKAKENKELNK